MVEKKKWKKHNGPVIDTVKGFDVIECEQCGFKHVIPLPASADMNNYYKVEFVEKRAGLLEKILEDLDWWRIFYKEKYDLLEQYLAEDMRTILDVGCGFGLFLKQGIERGWRAVGLEPSKIAAEYVRKMGIEIVNAPLTPETARTLGHFHTVHLHEVLEHIPNPGGFLGLVRNLLRQDGLICVVSPNDYNPLQLGLKNHLGFAPWWVAPPEHVNFFDVESLENLLVSKGFDVLEKTTTFPMEFFLYMGTNYVGNQDVGNQCHSMRKKLELNMQTSGQEELRRKLYQMFAGLGIGREILLLARKC